METAPANRRRRLAAAWCVIASLWMASGPLAVAGPTADPRCAVRVDSNRSNASPPGPRGSAAAGRCSIAAPHRARRSLTRPIPPSRGSSCPKTARPPTAAARWSTSASSIGLVITNWHVVRDSQGTVEVVFPERLPLARPAAQGRQRLGPRGARDLAAADRAGPRLRDSAAAGRPAHDPRLRPGPVPHRHRPLHRLLRAASSTSRARWSNSTSRPGKATPAARSSTSAASWPACCSGQGRGPRSAASPRASNRSWPRSPPTSARRHDQTQVAVADRPAPERPPARRSRSPQTALTT